MNDFQESRFRDDDQALSRRGTDPMIEVIMHKVTKVEASMEKVADALMKLAILEERQAADRAALERAFNAIQRSDERCATAVEKLMEKIEKSDARLDELERAAPALALTNGWMLNAVWAAAGLGVYIVVHKLGLMG